MHMTNTRHERIYVLRCSVSPKPSVEIDEFRHRAATPEFTAEFQSVGDEPPTIRLTASNYRA